MRIVVCGSSSQKIKMVETKKVLEELGHSVYVSPVYIDAVGGDADAQAIFAKAEKEHAAVKIEHDFIRKYFDEIRKADAILVVNYDSEKHGIQNYIGCNTLLEIGCAYDHRKKIFLVNPIPDQADRCDELVAMKPIVLDGDFKKIQ